MRSRVRPALSYVKVERRSRAPRLWEWSLRRDGSDDVLRRSEAAYGCAEDAWKAGRAVFEDFEATTAAAAARARAEALAQEQALADRRGATAAKRAVLAAPGQLVELLPEWAAPVF